MRAKKSEARSQIKEYLMLNAILMNATPVATNPILSLIGFLIVIILLLLLIARWKWHVFLALLIPIVLG